ncbi:Putative thioredoxin 2 [Polaromonas vacuolata]|uniref:Thioredoxin 2 n=1 Tax=Polaromonas vacuolata TaxID=37448 RepID=A0A6H2HBG8_9BURK|nr:thioredoxin family protein [Polaromonas vacuolata]QJC57215.1 Putative thioredoxin 2 [Polaromonas vacuolata]
MSSNLQASSPASVWVVCLCADWCGVCRDYRTIFESLVGQHSDCRFGWVDIEDHADLLGDMDIETFPTLLIADAHGLLFLGSLVPQASTLSRLLQSHDAQTKRSPHTADTRALMAALPKTPSLWL